MSNVNYKVNYVKRENVTLAIHTWMPLSPKALLFYIHGIQSHGGWLFETGPILAAASIAVFVLDRRGSGLSEGVRGDVPSVDVVMRDYTLVLRLIKETHPNLPLILYGQSLGGSLLAGLLAWPIFNTKYDAVIFCAPALGQQSHRLTSDEQEIVISNNSLRQYNLGLRDKDYTMYTKYLNFMMKDRLILRKITCRARSVFLQIEKTYIHKESIINSPCVFVQPSHDAIIDLKVSSKIFDKLTSTQKQTLILPEKIHYIEFSPSRKLLIQWLIKYIFKLHEV